MSKRTAPNDDNTSNKKQANDTTTSSSSSTEPTDAEKENLHELKDFAGKWKGTGFNMIALPTTAGGFRLRISKTEETIEFTPTGATPNRGGEDQPDVFVPGLTYLQNVDEVTDAGEKRPIHVEPGIWLYVPSSEVPKLGDTIVRLATVPHGDSLLAQSSPGQFGTVQGPPIIDDVSSTPFFTGEPTKQLPLGYLDPYMTAPMPAGFDREILSNPNLLLKQDIAGQKIIETAFIQITTEGDGGITNIPFIKKNADVPKMDSVFWLETVQTGVDAQGKPIVFQQMQYTQTVMLRFLGIDWPHISVATLTRNV